MSNVDIQTDIVIDRPRADVAAFAANPDNVTRWYSNIKSVEWRTQPPLEVGTKLAFVARFLGRTLAYVYEVRDHVPGERFVMSTADGPFAMETTYTWEDAPSGGTRMRLRNRGQPSGFAALTAPLLEGAMRRANAQDLARLKRLLEGREGPG
jgi:uncharacterized membrane protein